jgi:hypothetical protein
VDGPLHQCARRGLGGASGSGPGFGAGGGTGFSGGTGPGVSGGTGSGTGRVIVLFLSERTALASKRSGVVAEADEESEERPAEEGRLILLLTGLRGS